MFSRPEGGEIQKVSLVFKWFHYKRAFYNEKGSVACMKASFYNFEFPYGEGSSQTILYNAMTNAMPRLSALFVFFVTLSISVPFPFSLSARQRLLPRQTDVIVLKLHSFFRSITATLCLFNMCAPVCAPFFFF